MSSYIVDPRIYSNIMHGSVSLCISSVSSSLNNVYLPSIRILSWSSKVPLKQYDPVSVDRADSLLSCKVIGAAPVTGHGMK